MQFVEHSTLFKSKTRRYFSGSINRSRSKPCFYPGVNASVSTINLISLICINNTRKLFSRRPTARFPKGCTEVQVSKLEHAFLGSLSGVVQCNKLPCLGPGHYVCKRGALCDLLLINDIICSGHNGTLVWPNRHTDTT